MRQRCNRGQTTVEFALVIGVFLMVLLGAMEVARAIFEKQILARAAEVIANDLAQTDPELYGSTWTMKASDLEKAVTQANQLVDLSLNTGFPDPSTLSSYKLDAASHTCDAAGTGAPCQLAVNADGSVAVVGSPDLSGTGTMTIRVTVSQPYSSFIEYPFRFLGGNASETVTATTLWGQQQ
jgi:Flp pilus assembly protein TadG